jgi:HD-GYP domain-containing protein (c-di-GMP phosphodiesterase class II)
MSAPLLPAGAEGRSPAPEERELQRMARDFLFAFYAALRVLKLYPIENQSARNALRELDRSARVLLESEGALSVRSVGDFLFVNDLRLRFDLGSYATFGGLSRALRGHGVGLIEIAREVGPEEWAAALSALLAEPDAEDPFAALGERLKVRTLRHVFFGPLPEHASAAPMEHSREMARRTYVQSVAAAREVMTNARTGRAISLRRVKRTVQSIVDQVLSNEASIVGMTTLRDYDEYTFTHSVNVCILSVALGKKLALSKAQLYELGLGALLHDIGKVRVPREIITKTSQLSDEEWRIIREHPTEGLLALFSMRGMGEFPLRAMLMAYEHHMKADRSGYPASKRACAPMLYSRIVAVADGFDAATSKRSYQSLPLTSEQVLREMHENQGRGYDPLLVRAFTSMTGIYPVGSLVILDSYELAVVLAANPKPGAAGQPIVRIIYDEMGMPLEEPRTLDLSETDPATGRPVRVIVKTTDAENYGINVSQYIA